MDFSMKIKSYIDGYNSECKKRDIRQYDFILPLGTIVGVMCDENNKVVLIEANGKGGFQKHVFPSGVSYSCINKIKQKQKPSLIKRFISIFKK